MHAKTGHPGLEGGPPRFVGTRTFCLRKPGTVILRPGCSRPSVDIPSANTDFTGVKDSLGQSFGKVVRRQRERSGISQEALADRAGIHLFGQATGKGNRAKTSFILCRRPTMSDTPRATRLETQALVIGYAMSRLDTEYFRYRNVHNWQAAYDEASRALDVRARSIRNLRDEFDPFHNNGRRGWHNRPIHPSRQRVLEDLRDLSDDALMALVDRVLLRDEEATAEAVDSLAAMPRTAQNVAERLLTGRRAEDFFLAHSEALVGVRRTDLVDRRQAACGFDFAVDGRPELGIEVKGLKPIKGDILFTDREWTEARSRRQYYWLVVVGNLQATPRGKVVPDPYRVLRVECSYQVAVVAIWKSKVAVA